MTWLTPMVGLIAAGIAAPTLLLLYMLKLRRREIEVSSSFLWESVIRDMRANAPFQRLRKNILLLLQALALLFAALALAQPGTFGERALAGTTIVLIDHSASMAAREPDGDGGTRTRLDSAKEVARDILRSAKGAGVAVAERPRVMIASFAESPTILASATADTGALSSALDGIRPTTTASRLAPALRMAEAYAEESPGETRIVVLSDGAFSDQSPPSSVRNTEIRYVAIGSDAVRNTGILTLRAQREYDRPEMVTVFASLGATAIAAETAGLELSIDGEVVAVQDVNLYEQEGAGAKTGAVVIRLERRAGAVIRARLMSADALEIDNNAWAVLGPAVRPRVTLVTGGNPLLERALRAMGVELRGILSPAEYVEKARAGSVDSDVVILEDYSPPLDAFPPGAYLAFGAPPPIDGINSTGKSGDALAAFVSWDETHEALRYAGLGAVRVTDPYDIVAEDARSVIARLTSGPGIVEIERDGRHALVVGFDPLDSNWVFDRGYVLFLATAINHLASRIGGQLSQQLRPGGTLTAALPRGSADVRLRSPDGTDVPVTIRAGTLTHGPLEQVGVYELDRGTQSEGPPESRFAVSVTDEVLTALRVHRSVVFSDIPGGIDTSESSPPVPKPLRGWLVGAFIVFIGIEWYVFHRRVQL